jgi:hypothetical protein
MMGTGPSEPLQATLYDNVASNDKVAPAADRDVGPTGGRSMKGVRGAALFPDRSQRERAGALGFGFGAGGSAFGAVGSGFAAEGSTTLLPAKL